MKFGCLAAGAVKSFAPPPEPPVTEFPTQDSVGLPDGWTPTSTWDLSDGDTYNVTTAGTVVEGIQFRDIVFQIRANDVTVRLCKFINCSVTTEYGTSFFVGAVVEDCEFTAEPAGAEQPLNSSINPGGFEAIRCSIYGVAEGIGVGGGGLSDVSIIRDCYIKLLRPDPVLVPDWHGDGIQAYQPDGGGTLSIYNTTVIGGPEATSCLIAGTGHVSHITIERMLCSGAGYSLLLGAVPMDATDVYVEDGSWDFAPISHDDWDLVGLWTAWTCTIGVDGQVETIVDSIDRGT